ncbi:hypothetical protein [Motilibacter aurantiacus]|uniref:hypothetical protein n=1 Tax=Motilibacter aurantiacus TaxID=2714955 RepID=UPI00140A5AAA|nr:hypothetical protein [Motilibacter aurantiacus]NHC44868.1 hypothetical protein [Motilibacter aurantiacus]
MPRSAARPHWAARRRPVGRAVAAVLAAVGLVTGCSDPGATTGAPTAPHGGPSPAATGAPPDREARAAELAVVLDQRAGALLRGDRAGWLQAVDPAATAFAQRQAAAYDALSLLPLTSWSYSVLGTSPARPRDAALAADPESWVAQVELSYEVAGADPVPVRRSQVLTVVRRAEGWRLADDVAPPGAGRADADLWDIRPVRVAQGAASVVVADASLPPAAADTVAALADRSVVRVDEVWGTDWPRRVVVVVAGSLDDLAALLGREPGSTGPLAGLAAVTTGRVGGTGTTSGDRVLLNAQAYDELTDAGRDVVLTHEITHVATRAATRTPVPGWLVEGFADYVGFRGSGVPVGTAAEEALVQVRADGVPDALPGDGEFDTHIGAEPEAYELAWLACRMIAETHGEQRLVELYRSVAGGRRLDAALADVLGVTPAGLTAAWQAYLGKLAA